MPDPTLPLEGWETSVVDVLYLVYRDALLEEAPVRGLASTDPGRLALADRLARKDVGRLIKALSKRGMVLKVEIPFESKKESDAD